MEQQENVLKRGTSKAVGQRTVLNVILSIIFLGVGAALIVALVKCRADMSLGTRISCIISFAAAFGLGVWCLIDLFYGANQAGHIKNDNKLMVTPEDMSNYKISKDSKVSLFWTIMTIVLFVPAITGTIFMLVSDKGQSINALYMAPAFILGILTLYLAIRKRCKMSMITAAISENLVDSQEPAQVAQPAQELTPEQLRAQQIAEAQRRAAEALAQQQALAQQEALRQQALAQQEEIKQRVLAQQEAARQAMAQQQVAAEPVAEEIVAPVAEEVAPVAEPIAEPVAMTVPEETVEPVAEPVEEIVAPAVEEAVTEEPVVMAEPVVEPAVEQAPEEIKMEDIPVGEPPVEADEFELPDLDFGLPYEEPKFEQQPQPAPVQPAAVAPTIQIIFVTPNQNGQVPTMAPLNIPLQTANGTQTIQLVMGPNNQPTSAMLLPEGQTVEAPKKTRGRKPGSKNSTTKKKSTAKRKTTRKTTTRRTVKREAKPEEPVVEELPRQDAVGSALDSIGAKLDKISKELSK